MGDEQVDILGQLIEAINDSRGVEVAQPLEESATLQELITAVNSLQKMSRREIEVPPVLERESDDGPQGDLGMEDHVPHGLENAPDIDRIGEPDPLLLPTEIEYGTPVANYSGGAATLLIYWTDATGTKYTADGDFVQYTIRLTPDQSNLESVTWTTATVLTWLQSGDPDDDTNGSLLGILGATGRTFAVKVTKTAGVAGDSTTLCTYVYTVDDLNGNELGTSKAPKKWRNTNAKRKMQVPTNDSIGLAYYDESGTLQLFDANEAPAVTVC